MYSTNEPRTIEESYVSACATSDLRVEADRRGDGDVLIAAGWSPTRIGSALLRLHSEWDRAEKPTKPTRKAIDGLARVIRSPYLKCLEQIEEHEANAKKSGYTDEHRGNYKRLTVIRDEIAMTVKEAAECARTQAFDWYIADLEMLMGKLKSKRDVRREVTAKALLWGIEDAASKVPGVIGWWLASQCPVCDGTKEQVVQGSNRQSGKACRGCNGSGVSICPYGSDGRRIANFLDDCIQQARISIRKRLQSSRN